MRWYVISLMGGCLISAVMIVLSLRLYVSLEHPYWIFAGSLIMTEAALVSVRNVRARASLMANGIAFLGQGMAFLLGGAATFFGLMAIYSPNFQ